MPRYQAIRYLLTPSTILRGKGKEECRYKVMSSLISGSEGFTTSFAFSTACRLLCSPVFKHLPSPLQTFFQVFSSLLCFSKAFYSLSWPSFCLVFLSPALKALHIALRNLSHQVLLHATSESSLLLVNCLAFSCSIHPYFSHDLNYLLSL